MHIAVSYRGGGPMGIFSVVFSKKLEQQFCLPMNKIANSFAGTSIGAVLSLAYSTGKYTNKEIEDIFFKEVPNVFKKQSFPKSLFASKYGNKGLIEVLEKYFGSLQLKDCQVPTWTLSRNVELENLYLNSIENPDVTCAKSAILSSTAPHYFAPYRTTLNEKNIIGYDGGLFAQDPTSFHISELVKRGVKLDNILAITIGTGYAKEYQKDIKDPNIVATAKRVIDECLDSQIDLNTRLCKNLLGERHIVLDVEIPQAMNDMTKIEYMHDWYVKAHEYANSPIFYDAVKKIRQYMGV